VSGDSDAAGLQLVDATAALSSHRQAQLPARMSDMQPCHYPLVLTVRELIAKLNASLEKPFVPGISISGKGRRNTKSSRSDRRTGCNTLPLSAALPAADCTALLNSMMCLTSDDEFFDSDDSVSSSESSSDEAEEALGPAVAAPQRSMFGSTSAVSSGGQVTTAAQDVLQDVEVDFDVFLGQYWPRFNEQLKRGLEPSMVFAGR